MFWQAYIDFHSTKYPTDLLIVFLPVSKSLTWARQITRNKKLHIIIRKIKRFLYMQVVSVKAISRCTHTDSLVGLFEVSTPKPFQSQIAFERKGAVDIHFLFYFILFYLNTNRKAVWGHRGTQALQTRLITDQ